VIRLILSLERLSKPDQINTLLMSVQQDRFAALFLLELTTGMRRGQIGGLNGRPSSGYEPTSHHLPQHISSETRSSRTIGRPSYRAASNATAAVAPRFVPKIVPNIPQPRPDYTLLIVSRFRDELADGAGRMTC
jgi:hypothetical protein